jgi:hypothetical protein
VRPACLVSCSGWGFSLEEVEVPVELWHGAADPVIPVERVRTVAAELPNCRPHLADGRVTSSSASESPISSAHADAGYVAAAEDVRAAVGELAA